MKILGVPFEVDPPSVEEEEIGRPEEVVLSLALKKAKAVFEKRKDEGVLVIGSDTVVEIDGEILGKPSSKDQAKEYLRRLSGRWHRVYTSVAFVSDSEEKVFVSVTRVKFRDIPEEVIDYYVNEHQPFDKAGAYGIQDFAAVFVEEIEGDFFTVVGLPIGAVWQYLYEKGWWKVASKGEDVEGGCGSAFER